MFRNWNIVTKLRILFIPTVLIPMVIITFISFNIITRRLDERARAQLNGATSFIENVMQERKGNISNLAQLFSKLEAVKEATLYATLAGDSSQLEVEVGSFRASMGVDLIEIVDVEGNLLAQDRGGGQAANLPGNGKVIVRGVAPISGDDGEVIGTGILGYRINDIFLNELKSLAGVELLLAQDGKVEAGTIGQDSVNSTIVKRMSEGLRSGDSFLGSIPIGGRNHYGSYLPFEDEEIVGLLFIGLDVQDVTSARVDTLWTFIILLVVVTAFILVIGYLFARSFTNPIRQVVNRLRDIAEGEGDLTKRVVVESKDEMGDLAHWVNSFIEGVVSLVKGIQDAGLKINTSSNELTTTVSQQASSANQQSAAVSETTTTMEELAATSKQIADSSDLVVNVAAKTQEDAQQGVDAVKEMISRMEEIKDKNETSTQEMLSLGQKAMQINEVMNIINNIADQTKLIAFNAALEAASAGETGKRFGVVAVEIRRLADSVVESTEEIRSRISEIQGATNELVVASEVSTKKINDGFEFTKVTAGALEGILQGVKRTNESAKQISLATQQQRTASEQTVESLRELSEGVNQAVDATEHTKSVSSELSALSGDLKETIGGFKLEGNEKGRESEG